jgi:hypothetical protein
MEQELLIKIINLEKENNKLKNDYFLNFNKH